MEMATEVSQVYTTQEVAQLLRTSERSVRRLGQRGILTVVQPLPKLQRWRRDEVDRLLQGKPAKAEP